MAGLFSQGKLIDDGGDALPARLRTFQAAEKQAAFAGRRGHDLAHVGFVGHFGGVVDEVAFVVAEPAGSTVVDHLPPASPIVDDEHAAARHAFEADAGPVFDRIGRLQHDIAVAVEFLLGKFVLVSRRANPVEGSADLGFTAMIEPEKQASLRHGGDKILVDFQGIGGELVGVLPGDVATAEKRGRGPE